MSSLTKRTGDSKRDTPWPICLLRVYFFSSKLFLSLSSSFSWMLCEYKMHPGLESLLDMFCLCTSWSQQPNLDKLLQEPYLSYPVSQLQSFSRALLILFSLPLSPEDTKQEIAGLQQANVEKKQQPRIILWRCSILLRIWDLQGVGIPADLLEHNRI